MSQINFTGSLMEKTIFACLLVGIFFAGCSFNSQTKPNLPPENIATSDSLPSDFGRDFGYANQGVFELDKYIGTKSGFDCSSFVSLVNKEFNNIFFEESLVSDFYDKSGRKSKAIFNFYESKDRIVFNEPQAGDLIFFANTLGRGVQKNKDKKNITHVGIITKIMPDNTIEFAHYAKGRVKNGYINLDNKDTHKIGKKEVNSYIVSCAKNKISCLSSNRFAGFGRVR